MYINTALYIFGWVVRVAVVSAKQRRSLCPRRVDHVPVLEQQDYKEKVALYSKRYVIAQ
jgi:hypothetical protein